MSDTNMTCPRCDGELESHRQSETVTIWDCPDDDCHPGDGGGLLS